VPASESTFPKAKNQFDHVVHGQIDFLKGLAGHPEHQMMHSDLL
jgi:hypothetical protein